MNRLIFSCTLSALFISSACQTTDNFLYQRAMSQQAGAAELTKKSVEVGDHTIPYFEKAPAQTSDTILFLHGFGADKDKWVTPFVGAFQEQRLLIPDIPGFGDSTFSTENRYTSEKQVQRLFAFLDEVGAQKVHIVGNSMGGALALMMAAAAPQRVSTLSLLAPAGVPGAPRSEYGQSLDRGEKNRLIVDDDASLTAMIELVFVVPPTIPENARPLLVRRYKRLKPRHDFIFEEFSAATRNPEEIIRQVKAPTTIIWGDTDRVLAPEGGPILNEMLANSELHILEKCGHVPQFERPLEASNIVLDWIEAHQ